MEVQVKNISLTLVGTYHPPSGNYLTFIDDFVEWITDPLAMDNNIIVLGDFNLHVNDVNDDDAGNFLDSTTTLGLIQHVDFPTHQSGNILDPVLTELLGGIKIRKCYSSSFLSDHCLIECITSIPKPDIKSKEITYRSLKTLDCELMSVDVKLNMLDEEIYNCLLSTH